MGGEPHPDSFSHAPITCDQSSTYTPTASKKQRVKIAPHFFSPCTLNLNLFALLLSGAATDT